MREQGRECFENCLRQEKRTLRERTPNLERLEAPFTENLLSAYPCYLSESNSLTFLILAHSVSLPQEVPLTSQARLVPQLVFSEYNV